MNNNFTQNGNTFWQKPPSKFDAKKIKTIIITMAVVIFVLLIAGTCWYTVDEKQQAVVTTFGKVTDVTGAGIRVRRRSTSTYIRRSSLATAATLTTPRATTSLRRNRR